MAEALDARNAFVEENMGLVYACARRLQGRGMEFDDLVQAGCVGLIKAADAFDVSRGLAFSTYAVPVILGEIKRLFREGGAVKVSRGSKDRARALLQTKEALQNDLGREPSISELAAAAGLEVSDAAMLLSATSPVLSLTVWEEGGEASEDRALPVESPAAALVDHMALQQVMEALEELDRALVECRYFRGMTQTKTAEQLGMTQVQVSRREKIILQKLRSHLLR